MHYGFLSIGGSGFIANRSAGSVTGIVTSSTGRAIAKAIMPRVPYLLITGIVIFEVVDDIIIARRKAPDVTGPRAVGINTVDFIDTPVIRRC